jgi:hypothetical protein
MEKIIYHGLVKPVVVAFLTLRHNIAAFFFPENSGPFTV